MNLKKTAIWLIIGLCSGVIITETASANPYARRNGRAGREIRQDMREIRSSRADVRKDWYELQRDRAELWRDIQRRAPASEIARDRAEIRQDRQELAESRGELRRDKEEFYRDLEKHGWYRHSDGNWHRYPPQRYGWWDYDNWRERDRDRRWPWSNSW